MESRIAKGVLLLLSTTALIAADNQSDMTKEELIRQDYARLTGTFSLVSGVVDSKPVPEEVRKKTILVTDHNKFAVSTGDAAGTTQAAPLPSILRRRRRRWIHCKPVAPIKGKRYSGS